MRFIASLLLFLVFARPALADMQERRFEPTQKFTLKIDKVLVEVPYAYLSEYWRVNLKKNTVVNAIEYDDGAIFFQYLFPSMAPPPENCKILDQNCKGIPFKGFAAAPKNEKQFFVYYKVRKLKDNVPTDVDTAQFLRGPTANHILYGDKFTENKKLGLIESKPFLDNERYVPIEKLNYPTHLFCSTRSCDIYQYDNKKELFHIVTFHKSHLAKWKGLIKTRQTIFERYLKK